MTTEVRTPFATSDVELSADSGLYRKQILRFGTIVYTDRTGRQRKLTFDRSYGEDLVRAFRSGAYDQVPFQLADATNTHTNAPDRTGGEVVALTLSKDGSGVDGYLRLNPLGTQAVELNSKLGVSARILENLATSDGRQFPRAVQHVLGTVDPQVRGMRPWERVDSVDLASGTVTEALDLSTETYERSAMSGTDKDTVTLELSTAQAERLKTILEDDEALEALADQLGPEFFESLLEDGEQDEEDPDEDDEESDEDEATLSGPHIEALELARAQLDTQGQQILELTNQLNRTRLEAELSEFAGRDLAPAVIEAARPLLTVSPGAIELSNGIPGDAVDPGEVIREVLQTVIELANSGQLLISTDEVGTLKGADQNKSTRDAMLSDWKNYG
jgi:hypothetical protein